MPTVRTGAIGSAGGNALNADQLVVDMMEDVFQYDPPESPMMTIVTKRAQVRPAKAYEVKHLEDDIVPETDTLAASLSGGASTMTVTNPTYHRPGDIIKIPGTGETVRVLAVNTVTGVLDITRSWGTTAAAGANSSDYIINLGAAEMEGDLSPQAKATITTTKTNYAQIMKEAVEVTRTADNIKLYGGNERLRQRNKAGARHSRDWEQVMLHGEKAQDTSSGTHPIRSAGGIDEHITTNVFNVGGTLLESDFYDFVGDCFRYSVRPGRQSKLLLASRELNATISSWGLHKIRENSSASARYGMKITTLITPFGDLQIINHPLLELAYAGYGYIIDPDGIWYRPLRRTQLETNIQANGADSWKDQYITEASFSFALEKSFGKLYGVTY